MICRKNNLFDFTIYNENSFNEVYYYIGDIYHNSINVLGICENNIIGYSSEWLSLIKFYYPNHDIYTAIANKYEDVKKNISLNNYKNIYVDESIVVLITSFSNGTVHGFAGLFYMLIEYKKKYEGKKVLVYKNSLKAFLDIIYHIIPSDLIIEIDQHQLYKINNAIIIQNLCHMITDINLIVFKNFLNQYFIKNNNQHLPYLGKSVCIIKNNKSCNNTQQGVINYDIAKKYADDNNYKLIEPTDMNEVDLINILFTCEKACFTWGTSFFKNKSYLSENCKEIICLITPDFMHQFDKNILKKNSNITYYSINFGMNIIKKLDLA